MEVNYVLFQLEDYVDNPVALARIKARVSKNELARRLGVTQSYISKIERQSGVTVKMMRVNHALRGGRGNA